MKFFIALLGAMVAFPSSRGQFPEWIKDWVDPTEDDIKQVFSNKEVTSWSDLEGYEKRYAYLVNQGNDSK